MIIIELMFVCAHCIMAADGFDVARKKKLFRNMCSSMNCCLAGCMILFVSLENQLNSIQIRCRRGYTIYIPIHTLPCCYFTVRWK